MPGRSRTNRRSRRSSKRSAANYNRATQFDKGVLESDVDMLLRRTAASKTGSAASMAANALQLARGVASLLNTEYKRLDLSASLAPTTTYSYTCFNGCTQGTDATSRTGNSIRLSKLDFRYSMQNSSVAGTLTLVRMIIFAIKQPNGVLPASPYPCSALSILAPWDPDKAQTAILLHDELVSLTPGGDNQQITGSLSIPLSLHAEYSANTGNPSDLVTGAIWVMFRSNQSINTPTVSFYSRVQFVDN